MSEKPNTATSSKISMESSIVLEALKFSWAPIVAWFWSHIKKKSDTVDRMQIQLAILETHALNAKDAKAIMQDSLKPIERSQQEIKNALIQLNRATVEATTKIAILEAIKAQNTT